MALQALADGISDAGIPLHVGVVSGDGIFEAGEIKRAGRCSSITTACILASPKSFGFRGNSLHLDLNRDFIKCDSLNARLCHQLFTAWDPDLMDGIL